MTSSLQQYRAAIETELNVNYPGGQSAKGNIHLKMIPVLEHITQNYSFLRYKSRLFKTENLKYI
jgi:hypothetical protein